MREENVEDKEVLFARACGKTMLAAFDYLYRIFKEMILKYPNKRVKHLALHGNKFRTRKKNWHRIMRYWARTIKNNKTTVIGVQDENVEKT